MSKTENPSAFPNVEPRDPQFSSAQPGMTLRDWFAGQALSGLCSDPKMTGSDDVGRMPEAAYAFADAMLSAREQKA